MAIAMHRDVARQSLQLVSTEVTTSILISNLHCNSCVSTIKEALFSLSPPPRAVEVSIVTQTVTVIHPYSLSPLSIKTILDEAGFDITTAPTQTTIHAPQSILSIGLSLLPAFFTTRKRYRHIAQCAYCQAEQLANNGSAQQGSSRAKEKNNIDQVTFVSDIRSEKISVEETVTQTQKGRYRVVMSVGGMTCASCSNVITRAVGDIPGVAEVFVDLLGNSATIMVDDANLVNGLIETIEALGYEGEIISVDPVPSPRREDTSFKVILSVGGMTCASCSSAITIAASDIPGVSEIAVNLLGRSATAIITHEKLADQLVEIITEIGYEAEVINIESVRNGQQDIVEDNSGPRTISLRIDGMHCSHCPEKVMSAFTQFAPQVTILKPLTTHTDPIICLSYIPSPPSFTIRHIVNAISATMSPSSQPFTATLYHPPTVEARSRIMQLHEQRLLLHRLLSAIILAIPTFILGIVYMSLVPSSNATRIWLETPMWAGNTARGVWSLFFLATPAMFYTAGPFHQRSIKEIRALWRRGNKMPVWKRFVRFGSMNLLVSTGVSVAYFSSISLLALSAVQTKSPSGKGYTTTYFDSVVLLSMFLLAGRFLEAYSKGRTADAVGALGKLRPVTALLLSPVGSTISAASFSNEELLIRGNEDPEKGNALNADGSLAVKPGLTLERVHVDLLEVGDIVRVQHGATPPADGTVVVGMGGAFDESSLTGESRMVRKNVGDKVFLGTVNKGMVVDVQVDAIGGETMLDRIVTVVREGQTRRAPIERLADLLTGYFVPVVTLLAIITWVAWLSLGLSGTLPSDYLDIDVGGWPVWSLEFAIAVFVVACPCGIGLAAPTALLVGSGLAAKFGILVRGGGEAFQEAAQLDIIAFDKTGTITEGEPRVTNMEFDTSILRTEADLPHDMILGIAEQLESASSHPLATAIRNYCSGKSHSGPLIGSAFEETAGRGVKAAFEALNCTAIIGNEAWMNEHGCAASDTLETRLNVWKSEGKSVTLLALQPNSEHGPGPFTISAVFAITDPPRPEAHAVISYLHSQGIGTWMISGDNPTTAKAVARQVGISDTDVIAGVMPHEKAEKIQWLQRVGMKRRQPAWQRLIGRKRLNNRCIVAMVGDGINDAPALTAADVGIAIGSGSDVAISSASFILMSSNLYSLLTLTDLSRRVFNRVKFNFFWASIYNLIAIPIAAGVIYPAGHTRLAPVWASLAMALSSVSVVCSSLLLKLYKEPFQSSTRLRTEPT